MLINLSNKTNRYGQVGRRIEYTGDMANPAGIGAIVETRKAEFPWHALKVVEEQNDHQN